MLRKTTILLTAFIFIVLITSCNATTAPFQDLRGRIIILDAGHGFENTNSYAGYDEQATMLKLAWKIKPLLDALGATTLMVRPTEEDIPLAARPALINKWALQAIREARINELSETARDSQTIEQWDEILEIDRLIDITQSVINDPETIAPIYLNTPFDETKTRVIHPDWKKIFELEDDPLIRERYLVISLHSNATPKPINTSRNGVEVYHISNEIEENKYYYSNYSNESRSAYFGDLIIDSISALGIQKRGVSAYHYMITREHNLPCVLIENGFHTNPQDRANLSNDAFLDKLARAYVDTIQYYFATVDPQSESGTSVYDDFFG